MADANVLHIINYFPQAMTVSIPEARWNCCDEPQRGQVVGNISTLQKHDLRYVRTDGHGCNGDQGRFALSVTVNGATYTAPFDFDSHGNIESSGSVPGLSVYVKQIPGGTYDCALCPDV